MFYRGVLTVILLSFVAADRAPAKFRDFKVYTTSAPAPADAKAIAATMRLLNSGPARLNVHVSLAPNERAGFSGKAFDAVIEAGKEASWQFELKPPEGMKDEVLQGSVSFGDAGSPPARELYVAVQGTDPAGFADGRVEKITEIGRVVGTHAPRTVESIRRIVDAAAGKESGSSNRLALVNDGKSKYRLVLETLASAAETPLAEAVSDLQRSMQLKAASTTPIMPIIAKTDGPAIRVRQIAQLEGASHPDAYRLRTRNEDVIIEAATLEGLRNGIYGLLNDHLDCHWFTPKQLGEEFSPAAGRSVSLAALDETRSPSFFSSYGMCWGSAPQWDRQNRAVINRGRMNFGHSWAGFIDRKLYPFDKFPDMWSRDRAGKVQQFDSDWSATNFCSTNPDVIRIVAEKINAQFDANPDALVASIDPNDLSPLCQCNRCLALDKSYGVTPKDDKQMSDRLVHFSKEIYDRLKPEHKEKFLGILAYGYQTRAPKGATPHPHHATIVCDFPGYFDHTRPFNDPTSPHNREFNEIVKQWGAKVKQLGFYDYYGHYNFFGPWGILHKMREDLPAFREMGGTFVVIESQPNFAMHGLNLYVAARLIWDVDADVDVVAEQYVTKFYGPAAEPMRAFFRAAERHYALTRPGVETALRVGQKKEFWDELDGHLKRAQGLTRELGADQKRFADRVAFAADGFAFGKRAFDLPAYAGDLAYLKETKIEFDRMKAKYASADPYWPSMIPSYFYPDVDAMLKKLDTAAH
jgi:hypothetical protein